MAVKRSRRAAPPPVSAEAAGVDLKKNEEITAPTVRLVDGDSHSVVALKVALAQARQRGLDLVEVASNADPPVCKLMDFNALVQSSAKVQANAQERQRQQAREVAKEKEIRLGCKILQHDLDIKLRKVDELLEKGHRVTISATYESRRGLWREEYPKAIEVAKRVWQMYNSKYVTWFDYGASGNKQISVVLASSSANKGPPEPFPWEPGSRPPPFMIKLQEEAAAAREAGLSDPAMRSAGQGGRGARGQRRYP